ncbi:hypothetical protein IAQ61_006444, partial [Plenodomus lingam]|uniref:Predicted protein n=1 Tax=Leptosphaeria maculans (strain JN3 / isolate v23.1.3 / race Av1-4-5-6-7-8) TaxID=985895 RepID=E5AF59_LEPMJ
MSCTAYRIGRVINTANVPYASRQVRDALIVLVKNDKAQALQHSASGHVKYRQTVPIERLLSSSRIVAGPYSASIWRRHAGH